MGFTRDTAPTQFIETGGIRFSYRRFGQVTAPMPGTAYAAARRTDL